MSTHHHAPSAPDPRPAALTCLEDRPELQKLRAGVSQEFAPSNLFRQILADDVAEEHWLKQHISAIATRSLSLEIESAYDRVSQTYPNATPSLRTVLAWKEFHKDPACRASLSERIRGTRHFLHLTCHLAGASRGK